MKRATFLYLVIITLSVLPILGVLHLGSTLPAPIGLAPFPPAPAPAQAQPSVQVQAPTPLRVPTRGQDVPS